MALHPASSSGNILQKLWLSITTRYRHGYSEDTEQFCHHSAQPLGLAFSTQHHSLKRRVGCCLYLQFLLFYAYRLWMYHSWFKCSPTESHLACFHSLAILNKAATNTHIYAGVYVNVSIHFSGINAWTAVTSSYASCMFRFLRNSQSIFQNGCTTLHPISNVFVIQFLHILVSIW